MKQRLCFSRLGFITALALSTLCLLGRANADPNTVVFDAISGAGVNLHFAQIGSGGHRDLMGDKVNLGNTALIGPNPQLTGMDLVFAHIAGTAETFNSLNVNLRFYDSGQLGVDPVFTSPATGVLTFDALSAIKAADPGVINNTLDPLSAYFYHIDFATPISLADAKNIGIAINYQGDTGAGLMSSDNWSTALREGTAPTVGFSDFPAPKGGYLRDFTNPFPANPTADDYNFAQTDGRNLQDASGKDLPNSGTAIRLYAAVTVPEANTIGLALAGATVPLLGWMIRRRRQKA